MNIYEPTRQQLCQWCRLVHNCIKSFSTTFFGQKLEIETACFENPNNHHTGSSVVFITLQCTITVGVVYLLYIVSTIYASQYLSPY